MEAINKVVSTDIGKGVHGWEGTLIRRLGFVPSAATDTRHIRREARHPLLNAGLFFLACFDAFFCRVHFGSCVITAACLWGSRVLPEERLIRGKRLIARIGTLNLAST